MVQGLDEATGRGQALSRRHAGLLLDTVLADLVTDSDRVPVGLDSGTDEAVPGPDTWDTLDRLGPDGSRSDHGRPAPVPRSIELPQVEEGFIERRVPAVPVSDALLDEMAAAAVGWIGRTADETGGLSAPRLRTRRTAADPADGIGENCGSGETGGPMARLTVALLAGGLWNYRGRSKRPGIPTRFPHT